MKVFVVLYSFQESSPIGVFSTIENANEYAEAGPERFVTEWVIDEFGPDHKFNHYVDWRVRDVE